MGDFIAHSNVSDLLSAALPELVECRQYWNSWPEYTKGQKIGFIVGKYGIGAFFYVTMFRGVSTFNNLKRANMMAILERCASGKGRRVLEQSSKYAAKNTSILQKSFRGSIIIHNPNVPHHVLQNKHGWNRFVPLTGDIQKDFQRVVSFLEQHKILQCKRKLDYASTTIQTYRYSKTIGNDTVVAVFQTSKNNVPLLRNAWVQVNLPYNH